MKNVMGTLMGSAITGLLVLLAGCNGGQEHYYSIDDYHAVDKIDAHVHVNAADPFLIELGEQHNMRLITINTDAWEAQPITAQQEIALELKNRNPGRMDYITSFSMEGWEDAETWQYNAISYLEDSFEKGAVGAKVWKNIGLVLRDADGGFLMIDDPLFDPVFEYLTGENRPLYGHIGEPKNTWLPLEEMTVAQDHDYFAEHPEYHMYRHAEYPSYEEIIEARNNMLDKNPDLVFIGCHLGSMEWSIEMMAEHLDTYPNMIYDMAHRVPHLQYLAQRDRDKVRDFFIEYQDRFIYSTDLQQYEDSGLEAFGKLAADTWTEDWEFFVTGNEMDNRQFEGSFRGLKLPVQVVDKIYRENVRRWIPDATIL